MPHLTCKAVKKEALFGKASPFLYANNYRTVLPISDALLLLRDNRYRAGHSSIHDRIADIFIPRVFKKIIKTGHFIPKHMSFPFKLIFFSFLTHKTASPTREGFDNLPAPLFFEAFFSRPACPIWQKSEQYNCRFLKPP